MAEYFTRFMLWDSTAKDILVVILAFTIAQISWLIAAKIFPALRTKNKEGEPLYMPFSRLLITCAVFAGVYLPLATPPNDGDMPEIKTAVISIEKTTESAPKNGEEVF